MGKGRRISVFIWHGMNGISRRMVRTYHGNSRVSRMVLLLTTTGRKSGLPRTTPLQYEVIDSVYYVASARGPAADWFRNLQANPHVQVRAGDNQFDALAEAITDPIRVADFLEYRLQRHPRMIGAMLRMEGLPADHTRDELEKFAAEKAVVVLHKLNPG
jgi:deazaflavin-dependent oxidoreductase (nitroreductase family)